MRKTGLGYVLALVGATFALGSSYICTKVLLPFVPPLALIAWRFAVAALVALPVAWLSEGRLELPGRHGVSWGQWGRVLVIGALQVAGCMGLLFVALQWISPTLAAILVFTNPLWTALLARLFLGERLPAGRLLGLGLGIGGVSLVVGSPAGRNDLAGELLCLGGALLWSAATIVRKRGRPITMANNSLNFWQLACAGLLLALVAAAAGQAWPARPLSALSWSCFLWLAIPSSVGSFGLWSLALSWGGATRTSGYLFLAPLWTALLGWWLLGASLRPTQWAGGILVGAALFLINREPAPAAAVAAGPPAQRPALPDRLDGSDEEGLRRPKAAA